MNASMTSNNMNTSTTSVDINETNAQQMLIVESQQRPVIAYFWAEMNPASQQMLPVMEKIAADYQGDCLLARIDVAQQGMIAQQLGVQGLPTTMIIKDGRPIDGFAGQADEQEIRDILGKYLPQPWDKQLQQAQALIADAHYAEALPLLRQAYNDSSQRPDIGLHLARVYMEQNRLDEVESLLNATPMAAQDELYAQLKSQLHLKRTAAKTPEVDTLEKKLAANPDDLDTRLQLAIQYQQEKNAEKALELLLSIMKTNKQFRDGEAKQIMLDIFKTLGHGDPLVTEYQRQLFSLLY